MIVINRARTSFAEGLGIVVQLGNSPDNSGVLPLELEVMTGTLQRFHFGSTSIVGNKNDRDLEKKHEFRGESQRSKAYPRLSYQRIQSTNTSTITGRHAVNFIHDQTGPIRDFDTARSSFLFR